MLRIPRDLHDELVAHAREDAPNECCGMVAVEADRAVQVFRARNLDASPVRYTLDPRDQIRIDRQIEEAGWTLGAIYHSHTRSDPEPSQTDINRAIEPQSRTPWFPGALYIIIGVQHVEPDVRAWAIEGPAEQHQVDLVIE